MVYPTLVMCAHCNASVRATMRVYRFYLYALLLSSHRERYATINKFERSLTVRYQIQAYSLGMASCRMLWCAQVAVAATLLIILSAATPLVLHVAPHVASESYTCGRSADTPCTLPVALSMAPPGTTVLLQPGVYHGAYYVTTPIALVASSPFRTDGSGNDEGAMVVFDGGHRHRPLTFDNVPVHLEGVWVRNGLAERAGCVLVTRVTSAPDEINNFTRCVFTNCTAQSSASATTALASADRIGGRANAAAGAVGIYYDYGVGGSFELSRVSVEANYARNGHNTAVVSGGLLVRHFGPTAASANYGHVVPLPHCNAMLLNILQENLQYIGGVYRRVKGVLHAGQPVWKRVRAANIMIPNAPLMPHMIAYCPVPSTWHIVPISPGLSIVKALQRHPPCTSSVLSSWPLPKESGLEQLTPMTVSKWVLNSGGGTGGAGSQQVEALRFHCQDSATHCPAIHLVQATGAQAHRNGLYYPLNITRAGRPTFRKSNDGERTQYMWYCAGPREWIVSDDDPADASDDQQVCSRGIATLETMATHPLLAPGWRFWDVDLWRTSTGRNGIKLWCAPPQELTCSALELINSPMQDFHTGPYLLTNFSWNHRPTYALRLPYASFVWFCGTFSEWVVSETDPRLLEPNDERCSRALSSHPTQSPVPYHMQIKWAQYLDDEWVPTPASVSVRCVEDCPRVVVDSLGYQNGYKQRLGVYDAIGRSSPHGHRVYRRLFSFDGASFLYFNAHRDCWVVSTSLSQEDGGAVFAEACGGEPSRGLYYAVNWSTPAEQLPPPHQQDNDEGHVSRVFDPQPALSCDVHHSLCHRINVSAVLYTRQEHLLGIYEPLPYLHNQRPIYLHNITLDARPSEPRLHYMYYCSTFTKWVVGPEPSLDGRCPAWVASKSTSATHPLVNVHWVLTGDGLRWETSQFGVRLGCADEDNVTSTTQSANGPAAAAGASDERSGPRRMSSAIDTRSTASRGRRRDESSTALLVWDLFQDCTFSSNIGLSSDDGPAAGAILLDYGRTHVGDEPHGYIRKSTFRFNEATGAFSAGAVYLENTYAYRPTHSTWSEVMVSDNRGETGGVAFVSTKATLNRVQFLRNFGFGSGGGMLAIKHANISGSTAIFRNNIAQRDGGAGSIDPSSSLTLWRSEIVNNSALENEGTTLRGGTMVITESKVLSVTGYAISACFLILSASELSCSQGNPASLTDGFGCLPDVGGAVGGGYSTGAADSSKRGAMFGGARDGQAAGGSGGWSIYVLPSYVDLLDVVYTIAFGGIAAAIVVYVRHRGKKEAAAHKRGNKR